MPSPNTSSSHHSCNLLSPSLPPFFFFNAPATTEIYTLSLHDALPISSQAAPHTSRTCLQHPAGQDPADLDRKSTRLNSSHVSISYAVFCLKKKKKTTDYFKSHKLQNL